MEITYKVIFKGEITDESKRASIAKSLGKFFKIPDTKVDMLFNGKAYALKKGLTVSVAKDMQAKLKSVGIVTHLIKEEVVVDDITYQTPESLQEGSKAETASSHPPKEATKLKDQTQDKLSRYWKKRFSLIEKGSKEELSFKEKLVVQFNLLALIFGPFYYLFKGMLAKGVLLWAGILMLQGIFLVAEAQGVSLKKGLYFVFANVLPMTMANQDYYRHWYYKEKVWDYMPSFMAKPIVNLPVLVVSLMFTFGAAVYADGGLDSVVLDDVSGVWRANNDGTIVMIDLANEQNKSIAVNGNHFFVSNVKVDWENDIISMVVKNDTTPPSIWTIRKFENDDSSFYINITLANGVQDELSFVREL